MNRFRLPVPIACLDGWSGVPEAVEVEYPQAKVQLSVIHQARNSLRYLSRKDYKTVTTDLKSIDQAESEEQASLELDRRAEKWDAQYPRIAKSWRSHWANPLTIFDYPADIRKAVYPTNAIESLHSVIRKATNKRKVFPNDDAALKVVFPATQAAAKKRTMAIKNWKSATNRFAIECAEQIAPYL